MTGAGERCIARRQTIGQVALVVRDYDEAIDYYVGARIYWSKTSTQRKTALGHGGRRARPKHACFLRELPAKNSRRESEIKPEAGYSCFSTPMTSGATFIPIRPRVLSLSGSRWLRATGRLPSSRISMVTCGICFNPTPTLTPKANSRSNVGVDQERRHDRHRHSSCRTRRTGDHRLHQPSALPQRRRWRHGAKIIRCVQGFRCRCRGIRCRVHRHRLHQQHSAESVSPFGPRQAIPNTVFSSPLTKSLPPT